MRKPLSIGSIPANQFATGLTVTLLAGAAYAWKMNFTSNSNILSLWNFAVTMAVDDNTTVDSNGHLAYQWPMGSSLSSVVQATVSMSSFLDWKQSFDLTNRRTFVVWMVNNDSVSHTLYMYAKGYTQSVSAGG